MKVVIVGAIGRQIAMLRREYLPRLTLRFVVADHATTKSTKEMYANADKVLMLTKFVKHAAQDCIPRDKLVFVNGGVNDMRARLKALNDALPPVPDETPGIHVDTLASRSPFEVLRTADVGDVFTFKLPNAAADLKEFFKNVQQSRSYYRVRYGIVSSQVAKANGDIEVLVENILPVAKPSLPDPPPKPAPVQDHVQEPEPEPDDVPESTDVKSPPAEYTTFDARDLWREIFFAALPLEPQNALSITEAAVDAYTKRFA